MSHRFVPGEVNITFMSVEELSSTRTGSLLLLTASKSKKLIHKSRNTKLHNENHKGLILLGISMGLSGVKLRMLGAGGLFWGSTSWSVQRQQRGFFQWRESTGMKTSVTPLTVSWTTTLHWWRLPQTSSLQTSFATPACHASRPASNQDTTAGWQAGETHGVSRTGFK